jgi:leader peptidase (prepilin peptidase)/N-methyltransferase
MIAALAWGSFLNVVARRLLTDIPLTQPSHCPRCKNHLAWWHLIPIISWLLLRGRCAYCKSSISWLYPLGELLSALSITLLFNNFPLVQAVCYTVFISALLITIQTDLQELVIIRYFSVGLIPLGILASALGLIPLSLQNSVLGTSIGYLILWFTGFGYRHVRKQEGLGEGDMELLAGIGAWTGWLGVWFTLTVAALLGVLIGPLIIMKRQSPKIPFGPLLAIAAFLYLMFQDTLQALLCLC